ncbi:MAG: hypothetical protein K6U09_03075 [Acidobacteriia bacterium]|nr:hypothetical protein [Terriglobia bacterium]
MRSVCFSLALLAALAAAPASAQELLPAELAGWRGSALTTYEPAALETIVGSDAAVLREYGIRRAEQRQYARAGQSFTLTLYRMLDPSAAYGAFHYLRGNHRMINADIAQLSAVAEGRTLAVTGNLLIEATGANPLAVADEVKQLVAELQPRTDKAPFPVLEDYLPTEGRVVGSERYLLGPTALNRLLPISQGDWVGFGNGAEAQLARYRINGRELTLLLINYPTPQLAQHWLGLLQQRFNLNSQAKAGDARPTLYARRSSALVAVVAEAESSQMANRLLDRIQVETQVTWNEPGFLAEEPPFSTMLIGVFLGTGLLVLFCIFTGLAFAGVRLFIQKILPNKVFDRPKRVEILQLGLSSKPIQGTDLF